MRDKLQIINEYILTRTYENDTVSETYRGGVNEKIYLPLTIDEIKEKWKKYLSKSKNQLIDFYIHIPFCYKKCSYCFYYKEVYEKQKLNNYLNYLELYLSEFIDIFKGIKFKSLYIGGGTPTLLSSEQIYKLLNFINANFEFHKGSEITYEGNPLSFNKDKIEIITKLGVNRISMGVQSLDKDVLKSSNREYQNIKMIEDNMRNIRINGIKNINIDLIMGLKEDTVEKFFYTLKKIIKMNPYSITIYWLGPTKIYLDKYYGGDIDIFFKDINSKIDQYYNMIISKKNELGKNIDYNIDKNNGHIWSIILWKNKYKKLKYSYNDFGEGSLFGVGPSSRSHIFGELVYKTINNLNYNVKNKYELLNDIINYGDYIDINDEISLYVITEIRDRLFINHKEFFKKFGIEFKDYFKEEINYFLLNGLLTLEDEKSNFIIDISKRLYYSMFFISKSRLIEKNIINEMKFNTHINYCKNGINFKIFLYFDKKIKFKIINNNLLGNNEEITINNIKRYYNIICKIKKIIEIFNREKKELLNSISILKRLFNNL